MKWDRDGWNYIAHSSQEGEVRNMWLIVRQRTSYHLWLNGSIVSIARTIKALKKRAELAAFALGHTKEADLRSLLEEWS